jgi:hypothetical protein
MILIRTDTRGVTLSCDLDPWFCAVDHADRLTALLDVARDHVREAHGEPCGWAGPHSGHPVRGGACPGSGGAPAANLDMIDILDRPLRLRCTRCGQVERIDQGGPTLAAMVRRGRGHVHLPDLSPNPTPAEVYADAVARGLAPTEAVASLLGVSRASAGRLVAALRKSGAIVARDRRDPTR